VEFLERNICGVDVHCWRDGWIGEVVVKGSMVLDHEAAGLIGQTTVNI